MNGDIWKGRVNSIDEKKMNKQLPYFLVETFCPKLNQIKFVALNANF